MRRHGEELGTAARSGDRAAYAAAQQRLEPDAQAVYDGIERLEMAHAAL